jgi:hypothetical protein
VGFKPASACINQAILPPHQFSMEALEKLWFVDYPYFNNAMRSSSLIKSMQNTQHIIKRKPIGLIKLNESNSRYTLSICGYTPN